MRPAKTLAEIFATTRPEPLRTDEEMESFYREELNLARGGRAIDRLALGLHQATAERPFKAFLIGHAGVGKSTEISRLIRRIASSHEVIRFSATADLDPGSFQPFDVLTFMVAEILERTAKPIAEGGAGFAPPAELLQGIVKYFSEEEVVHKSAREAEVGVEAGVGGDSVWATVLGLFVKLKGQMRYAASRDVEIVEYRLKRLSSLIELANQAFTLCNHKLQEAAGKSWLVVGEDFDKQLIAPPLIEKTFLTYGQLFDELKVSYIFNIPIDLAYSERGAQLKADTFTIPDTPVYDQAHQRNEHGIEAIKDVLRARVDQELFSQEAMESLIIASGGNLRDLFKMVKHATENALLRNGARIERADSQDAIYVLRKELFRRLGQSPYDHSSATYEEKVARLIKIYGGDSDADKVDPVLRSLLMARAVQEFNGLGWFGVHPLIVDILAEKKVLKVESGADGIPGGLLRG